jgi:outer membrane immunogenic protein
MFRKTWEALAGAVVFAGSVMSAATAQAADLGGASYGSTKDSGAVSRPHIGNWSGLYMGVNAGLNWDTYTSDYKRFADLSVNPDSPKYSSSHDGGLLGGHLGIQHQMGRIVVGVEGSWSGTGPFGNEWHGEKCFSAAGGARYSCEARMNSYFTVGPRLGLAHDNMMFYVTGGFASGQIQSREFDPLQVAGAGIEKLKWAARHDGWFIGAGAEMMLRDRWVLGLEYLHVDLDSQTHYKPIASALSRQIDGETDILRVRLSYKFGRGDGGYTNQPLK